MEFKKRVNGGNSLMVSITPFYRTDSASPPFHGLEVRFEARDAQNLPIAFKDPQNLKMKYPPELVELSNDVKRRFESAGFKLISATSDGHVQDMLLSMDVYNETFKDDPQQTATKARTAVMRQLGFEEVNDRIMDDGNSGTTQENACSPTSINAFRR